MPFYEAGFDCSEGRSAGSRCSTHRTVIENAAIASTSQFYRLRRGKSSIFPIEIKQHPSRQWSIAAVYGALNARDRQTDLLPPGTAAARQPVGALADVRKQDLKGPPQCSSARQLMGHAAFSQDVHVRDAPVEHRSLTGTVFQLVCLVLVSSDKRNLHLCLERQE